MAEQAQHAARASGSRARPAARRQAPRPEPVNEVRLLGRVSAEPEVREMPSGDELVTWRLVVGRGLTRRAAPAGTRVVTVDTLDCVAWSAPVRRTARGLAAGDVVEVSGALRKRFWRTGAGASSRTEVEVARVRRLARA
jgi:single-strand DNA-binding protein